jgi:hypothetical protein
MEYLAAKDLFLNIPAIPASSIKHRHDRRRVSIDNVQDV